MFKQESKQQFLDLKQKMIDWNYEKGVAMRWALIGQKKHSGRDNIKYLMDNFITGNDFYIDEKHEFYVRMVRNTFSWSRKARYLVVVEIRKSEQSDSYDILIYSNIKWKRKDGMPTRYNLDEKPRVKRNLD